MRTVRMNYKSVTVLMSTYNGEKFVKDQIESILKQDNVDVSLIIRDDGSTDDTLSVINNYSKRKEVTIVKSSENLGYKNSFLTLLKHIPETSEYVAFSDQDDLWLPEKLEKAVQKLEYINATPYKLYYSSLMFVDQSLNILGKKSFSNFDNTFGAEMVRNSAAGTTMVFSRELADLAVKSDRVFDLPDGHDSWIFKLNLAVGGKVAYDDDSYILFRRHENNVSNAGKKWINKLFYEFKAKNVSYSTAEILLSNIYRHQLTQEAKGITSQILGYKSGLKNRIMLLKNHKLRRENKIMNSVMYFNILTKKF